jgi:hypothetical protein
MVFLKENCLTLRQVCRSMINRSLASKLSRGLSRLRKETPANPVVSPAFYWPGITQPKTADGTSPICGTVDQSIADDMFTVLHLIRVEQRYPDDQGFKDEMQRIWQQWRSHR